MRYEEIEKEAKLKWDHISHPLDSLGGFETDVARLCAMQGSAAAPDLKRRAAVVFCGDHGVVAEGVTQTGQDVTRIMADEFAAGGGIVNIFAKRAGADVFTVDMGMNCPQYPTKEIVKDAVIDRKVARGTKDLYLEPAMTEIQMQEALASGAEICIGLKKAGYQILTCGEMGIGNTTSSSIITAALTGLSAEDVTGRGAGLSDTGLEKKKEVVRKVLAELRQNAGAVKPLENASSPGAPQDAPSSKLLQDAPSSKLLQDAPSSKLPQNASSPDSPVDPFKVLIRAGGFEIAGMTGLYLGAARCHMPVIIDGVISGAAALCAARIDPESRNYMLASHVSYEIAGIYLLRALGLQAPITSNLHQGEGTGALMLLPLLDMAIDVYREMGSFEDLSIESYKRT